MRIFSRSTIREYADRNGAVREQLWAWFHEAEKAVWKGPVDIKARYRSADFLPGDRVVFNLKGNDYRLIAMVSYSGRAVFVRFIGTHGEYDKIDATKV